jgi:hypothetical protein
MTTTDKTQVAIATALLGSALTIGGAALLLKDKIPPKTGGADDAPIVMAGGSVYFGTAGPAVLNADHKSKKLVHSKTMRVFQVDILDPNQTVPNTISVAPQDRFTIELKHCELAHCNDGDPQETVSVAIRPGGRVEISNEPVKPSNNVDDAYAIMQNLRVYSVPNWTIRSVTVNGLSGHDVPNCGPIGRCKIVLHTCSPGQTCIPVQP